MWPAVLKLGKFVSWNKPEFNMLIITLISDCSHRVFVSPTYPYITLTVFRNGDFLKLFATSTASETCCKVLHERNHWISIENRSVSQLCMCVCVCLCVQCIYIWEWMCMWVWVCVCCGCLAATSGCRLKLRYELQLPRQTLLPLGIKSLSFSLFLPTRFFGLINNAYSLHMCVYWCVFVCQICLCLKLSRLLGSIRLGFAF